MSSKSAVGNKKSLFIQFNIMLEEEMGKCTGNLLLASATPRKATRKKEQGEIVKLFASLYEHDRSLDLSEQALRNCEPSDVLAIFDLILPPNRTEDLICLALEKCAAVNIAELYKRISVHKKSIKRISDLAIAKCVK